MTQPRVFVSYTKRRRDDGQEGDSPFVLRLMAKLGEQPVDVWIYEDDAGQIPGGESISKCLRQQIDQCDVFLPVVSENSFRSSYTGQEVAYALAQQDSNGLRLIVPFVSSAVEKIADWPEPYDELRSLRYRVVDFDSAASLDTAILEFCKDVGVDFRPDYPEDSMLPSRTRFLAEVRQKCPRRDDREVGNFCRLMDLLGQFTRAFTKRQFAQARWDMEFFCQMARYDYPNESFYYPYVVRAVCEVLTDHLDEAARIFSGLLTHPLLDESAYSGLGYIHYMQGDFRVALSMYQQALTKCPDDAPAMVGVVMNSIMCGEPVDLQAAFRVIDAKPIALERDRVAAEAVKALALASRGDFRQATPRFEELIHSGKANAATVIHFARMLRRMNDLRGAISVLQQFRTRFADRVLLHDLATYTLHAGKHAEATSLFQELVRRYPHERRYRIELAQLLWGQGQRERAKRLAAEQLQPPSYPLPATAEDFYFDGFANWIRGQRERAEYDFQRSGFPEQQHYKHLLPT